MEIPTKAEIESLKEKYPEGTVVELINMDDAQAPLPGTCGEVTSVDDMGQVHVNWTTGSTLALVPGVDMFKKIERFKINTVEKDELPAKLYVLVDTEEPGFPSVHQSEPLLPESDWIHPLGTWLNLNIK